MYLHSNVEVEHCLPTGQVFRKESFKPCCLKLLRREQGEMHLEIRGKNMLSRQLKHVVIHSRFVHEGKACLKFLQDHSNVFISNAPPSELNNFLESIKKGNSSSSENNAYPQNVQEREKLHCTRQTSSGAIIAVKRPHGWTASTAKRTCFTTAQETLTDEQREILEAAKSRQNIFFTGAAGTGKSHLLKVILTVLPPETTFVTASTGVAASQLGGMTLHQFAGLGRGDGSVEHCIELASRPKVRAVWRKCQHLIIDEISMVRGDFFEKLEQVARAVRENRKPFGGIQLILCGDFFQLPPVGPGATFCFETDAWERCVSRCFELTEMHRQTEPELINLLECIRMGSVPWYVHDRLTATSTQDIEKDGIKATILCTHTEEASRINSSKLEELPGVEEYYKSEDDPSSLASLIDSYCSVPSVIALKVGAQVMLMKNISPSRGLVNGARGVVVGFNSDKLPVVKFSSLTYTVKKEKFVVKLPYKVPSSRTQIPLNLAWAFSIHKSQGMTLDRVQLSLSRMFEAGQAYVALSRVRSLDCLRVTDLDPNKVWASPKVLNYQKKLREMIETSKRLRV